MRTLFKKSGFELIFSVSLIVIMALPPLVFAQSTKDLEIKITNGDTVINGKNIKKLSPDERAQALKDIDNLGSMNAPRNPARHRIFIRKSGPADTGNRIIERRGFDNGDFDREMADGFKLKADSNHRLFRFRMKGMGNRDSALTFNYRRRDPELSFDDREWGMNEMTHRGPRTMEFRNHRNTQNFDYTSTGSDGISTHVSFRITEPSPEKLKEMGGSEKPALEIKDLNLVPEFSSGKITLMFGLPTHAIAEVKLTDHDGKLIWSDKASNGSFNRTFALGLNGIYFLQVKQAGKIAVKRIVKEE